MSTHKTRNVRLFDAQYLSGGRLGKSAILDKPVNLQREAGLNLLTFGVGKAQVPKDVAAAFFDGDLSLLPHLIYAFLCSPALPQRAAADELSSIIRRGSLRSFDLAHLILTRIVSKSAKESAA
jgi:hypothetical protein